MQHAAHAEDILRFTAAYDDVCLCVVTKVTGGAMRPEGALMAVTAAGQVAGYVSNGCVDADIIAHAQQALEDGERRDLLYGDGSPFFDISLPCGGAIALTLLPRPDQNAIAHALGELRARRETVLDLGGGLSRTYHPRLKLRLAGRGAALTSLSRLAMGAGFLVEVSSPDIEIKDQIDEISFTHLTGSKTLSNNDDKWTAHVLLFHDHDWEPPLLKAALDGPAFFIGAMGSRKTQAARRETLGAMRVAEDQIARIRGPVGLIPSLRDAQQLAVSILAEIIQTAQDKGVL